jgi:hypothetical protein
MMQKRSREKTNKKAEIHIKCLMCGEEIEGDTNKKMIYCKCEAIGIDGCEHYIRVNGDSKNWKIVRRKF